VEAAGDERLLPASDSRPNAAPVPDRHDLAAFVLPFSPGISVFTDSHLGCRQRKAPGLMARILGESGRYVSEQATRRSQTIRTLALITMAALGVIGGFAVGSSSRLVTLPLLSSALLAVALLLLMWLVGSRALHRIDELEKERDCMRKGAAGEKSVAHTLGKLPDEFRVVNDVSTPTGNLDHVVIGPTGVFVIETKDWRGIVGADGKGELTRNGKSLPEPHVKRFIGRVMGAKARIHALVPTVDPFFKAVMVFTSAWVEAKFGTTRWADCISDTRLVEHIVDSKPSNRLSTQDIVMIAHAFASLARMDQDFCAKSEPAPRGNSRDASVSLLIKPANA
jgi:hypothetical protein